MHLGILIYAPLPAISSWARRPPLTQPLLLSPGIGSNAFRGRLQLVYVEHGLPVRLGHRGDKIIYAARRRAATSTRQTESRESMTALAITDTGATVVDRYNLY